MSFAVAAVGIGVGVAKLWGASKAKKAAAKAQKKAQAEMDAKKKEYEALDTSNLAANQENKMEDLTINQKGMDIASQKKAQSRSNIMDGMNAAAGGSGIAALAQTMANQGSKDAAADGAMIGDQEAANQKASSTEASRLQTSEIAGADAARGLKYDKTSKLMGMAAGQAAAAGDAKAQAGKDQMNAIGGIATSAIGLSDRNLKKNITKIGQSNSGLNIYSFEYKNPVHGKGLFQGVMADEAPIAALASIGGYDAVDYNMIDVEFKNI
jgi:hypothetical protein